jgi:hypothetical protein
MTQSDSSAPLTTDSEKELEEIIKKSIVVPLGDRISLIYPRLDIKEVIANLLSWKDRCVEKALEKDREERDYERQTY